MSPLLRHLQRDLRAVGGDRGGAEAPELDTLPTVSFFTGLRRRQVVAAGLHVALPGHGLAVARGRGRAVVLLDQRVDAGLDVVGGAAAAAAPAAAGHSTRRHPDLHRSAPTDDPRPHDSPSPAAL